MGSVCKWADDSQYLILRYFDTIYKSPSQLYSFALPWCPSSSWLHKYHTAELLQVPRVIKGAEAKWGTCSRIVSLNSITRALSYWNNTIAVGSEKGDITILDATTGSQIAILSGHLDEVNCLTFSSDGKLLVSGSDDKTVKLWDVQTGGIVKTFHGHTSYVLSVSILADCTMIASGSFDSTACLWDIQTQECLYIIKQQNSINFVSFSPTYPQYIISISDNKVQQWDATGHQIPPTYNGSYIAFSPDHDQFALCNGSIVTVQDSDSKAVVAKFHVANTLVEHCCFSPDNRFVAATANRTAYVWDITIPDPHLVETFVGHTEDITALTFSSPSSLISTAEDRSVKFWKIGTLSTDPATTDPGPALSTLPPIHSVSLQARAGIAISSDVEGVVKTWDISTGLCKESFRTPAKYCNEVDVQLIDNQLIIAWNKDYNIHIWDINKGKFLQTVVMSEDLYGLRISGDGSKVFCLTTNSIQALSMRTGELVSSVELELYQLPKIGPLQTYDSRIWIQFEVLSTQGWDFGILGSPTQFFDVSTKRPLLDFIFSYYRRTQDPSWIKDTVTGKEVFRLSGRHAKPRAAQWDGQYLVAGYDSGEVLILDFYHMCPQ